MSKFFILFLLIIGFLLSAVLKDGSYSLDFKMLFSVFPRRKGKPGLKWSASNSREQEFAWSVRDEA